MGSGTRRGTAKSHSPLPTPCWRDPHHGARCTVGSEHDGLALRPHRHIVPRNRRRHARCAPQSAQRPAGGERQEGLVHALDRLRDRPGGQAAPRDDSGLSGGGRQAAPRDAAGHRVGARRGRRAQGRQPRPCGAGHQACRGHGLRRVPPDLRDAGREGAHEQAPPRRFRRRDDHPDKPGDDRHRRIGAAPDEGSGLDHRYGRDPRLFGGGRQGHDDHQHLRPPRHSGRGVGTLPAEAGLLVARRGTVLRGGRGESGARGWGLGPRGLVFECGPQPPAPRP